MYGWLIGAVKDDTGYTWQNLRDKLDIKLTDETAAQLAMRPIQIEIGFTLLPGKYVIKLLARDAETGRMAPTRPHSRCRTWNGKRRACRSARSC